MRITKTIKPGATGSRRFLDQWGHQLVAVRYRKDERQQRTLTTIEIIVDERPLIGATHTLQGYLARRNHEAIALKIDIDELDLRGKVKAAGARWSYAGKLWVMRYGDAVKLGLGSRIVQGGIDRCTDIDTSIVLK